MQRFSELISTPLHRWAIDLGTGAGFAAFAMAAYSRHVLATDPTLPMLQQARCGGLERRLANLMLSQNGAEALPIASGSIDLITSRMAAHHFADLGTAPTEARRILPAGGALLTSDSIPPEDVAAADGMNDVGA